MNANQHILRILTDGGRMIKKYLVKQHFESITVGSHFLIDLMKCQSRSDWIHMLMHVVPQWICINTVFTGHFVTIQYGPIQQLYDFIICLLLFIIVVIVSGELLESIILRGGYNVLDTLFT